MSQVAAVSCGDSRFAYPRRAVGIAQAGPRFDVASVKPNRDESKKMATLRMWGEPGGRVSLVHISMRYVLMHVFSLQEDQITGPGWLDSGLFRHRSDDSTGGAGRGYCADVSESAGGAIPASVSPPEERPPAYSLTVVPGGPKLDPPTTAEGETVETHGKITGSGDSRGGLHYFPEPFWPGNNICHARSRRQ